MKYKTVIITGASSGLGEEFAHQLASDSEHLVLVARRAKKLEGIKKELSEKFDHLKVSVEALDLNEEKDVSGLCEKISDGTYEPHVLINNAGMGDIGSFEKRCCS